MTSIDPATTQSGNPSTSVWEDIAEIFVSPSAVFARRQHGRFGAPLLIYLAIAAALAFAGARALEPATTADARRMQARIAERNPEMAAQIEQQGTGGPPSTLRMTLTAAGTAAAVAVGILVAGLATWIIGLLFGSTATVGMAVMVVTFAQFPRILQQIVILLQGLLLDPGRLTSMFRISPSAARFLDPGTTPMTTLILASRLDPFLLWATALIGIGMHVVGGLSKWEAAAVAILVWVLGTGPLLLPALFF